MDSYSRRKSHNSSLALLATLVLGAAIGLSVGYAVWGTRGEAPEKVPAPTTNAAPEPAGQEPAPMAVTPDAKVPAPPAAESIPEPVPEPEAPPTTEPIPKPVPGPEAPPDLQGRYQDGAETWPGLFLFVGIASPTLDEDTKKLLAEIKPGGVVLSGTHLQDQETVLALTAEIKQAEGLGRGIDSLPVIVVEQEGGDLNSLGLELAPSAAELGRGANKGTARAMGRTYAVAAVSRGIGVILAPVLDVSDSESGEVMAASRTFGTDQEQVAIMGLSFAEGVMDGGAIPVAKYYPGIATAQKDSENMVVLEKDDRRMAELMYPYEQAAKKGIPGIMVGNVAVPALDKHDPVRPALASPVMVQKILREWWNYTGVILAADVALDPMTRTRSSELAAVEALAAGCDAVLFLDPDVVRIRAACAVIGEAIANGTISRVQLSESKKRIKAWQDWLAVSNPERAAGPPTETPVETPGPTEPEEPASAASPPETEEKTAPPAPVATETPAVSPTPVETVTSTTEPVPVETATPATEPGTTPESVTAEPSLETTPPLETQLHTVVVGDQLKKIAGKYGTTVEELIKLNKLADPNKVLLGQQLIVPKTAPAAEVPAAVPESSPTPEPEVQSQPAPEPAPIPGPAEQAQPAETPEPEVKVDPPVDLEPRTEVFGIHVVAPGDQLKKIAARYGITSKRLMELNGITDPNKVLVGQQLRIPMGAQLAEPLLEPEPVPVPEAPAPNAEPEPAAAKEPGPSPEPKPGLDNVPVSVVEAETVEDIGLPEPQTAPETEAKSGIEEDETPAETVATPGEVIHIVPPPPNTVLHVHLVEPGETLANIAERYGIGEKEVMGWNALSDNTIRPGQTMLIHLPREEAKVEENKEKVPTQVHIVTAGEGLKRIGERYNTTVRKLMELNNLDDPDAIQVGQRLAVPKTP